MTRLVLGLVLWCGCADTDSEDFDPEGGDLTEETQSTTTSGGQTSGSQTTGSQTTGGTTQSTTGGQGSTTSGGTSSTTGCDEDIHPDCAYEAIPLSEVSATATHYSYEGETATIVFFVVSDDDGGVHTAFDACDVCYQAGLGYSQSGTLMVCNNCGNRYPIKDIGEQGSGGCWPGHLPHEIIDEQVILMHDDLESGAWYFE